MKLINLIRVHSCSFAVKNVLGRWLLGLPNIVNLDDYEEAVIGIANDFKVLVGDWVKIFPYGDVAKKAPTDMRTGQQLDKTVMQRFNREAADKIVANFNDAATAAGANWTGRPWFVGHPDVPGLENTYPDKKAYGWIMAVEARDDGLYGQVKWSAPGRLMLDNAHYKFHSPFVLGPRIGVENGMEVYLPVWLESVGFTNTPNIRGTVLLVNTRHDDPRVDPDNNPPSTENVTMNKKIMDEFRALLNLPNADDNTVVARLKHLAKLGLANSALGQPVDELQKLIPAHDPAALAAENASLNGRVTELQMQFNGERAARIKLELDGLVREGRVTAAEVAFFNSELRVKFDDTLAQLRRRPANFGGRPQTGDLGARKIAGHKTPAEQFTALVNEALPRFGGDWAAVKREHPALVAEMEAKK
jgi:phage I-like protein